ncbi:MAG: cytochrome c biogenesis CcdA family protein, partial [Candidatus Kariarchaeaceae archaeon]
MAVAELLVINLILGLLSAFSPCLFPLLPSYVAMILQTKQSRRTVIFSSFFLILGLMVVFLFIGAISNSIGSFLISNYSLFAKIQGAILILAGLFMIRTPSFIYKITLPDRVENWLYDENRGASRPYLFSFMLGLLFTIIAAPCASGFFLFVWFTLAGQTFTSQVALVLAFAVGVGLPFLLIAL